MSDVVSHAKPRLKWWYSLVPLLLLLGLLGYFVKDVVRKSLVKNFTPEYQAEGDVSTLLAEFSDLDADRQQVPVQLVQVADGLSQITDIQFPPGSTNLMFVTEKGGGLHWLNPADGTRGKLAQISVTTVSEQGLLGLAFHPHYAENGLIFLNRTIKENNADVSVIESRVVSDPTHPAAAKLSDPTRIMTLAQPYQNHNAGGMAFGPDGMLYLGWGDGGWMNDPGGHGQNGGTLLGSMLRIDINGRDDGKNYAVPADNPFIGRGGYLPETWAIGVRNPWRISFHPDGRLVVADVGQDAWEEITLAPKGANLGWNRREGDKCFPPNAACDADGLTDPVYVYSRQDGSSVTGGYVHTGGIAELKGKYLFGDFVSGRIWAIDIPSNGGQTDKALALGKWPILISTFGRDAAGEVYVADFAAGAVYRITAAR